MWPFFSFLEVAGKRDLVFIAIGELHVRLAWDFLVIPFRTQIAPKENLVEVYWPLVLISTKQSKDKSFVNHQRN
jgi:hypothetical protein